MKLHRYLAVSLLAFGCVLVGLWLIFGCAHAPTERPFPCDGIVRPLSPEETLRVQTAARQEVRDAVANGTLKGKHLDQLNRALPRVEYVACDWIATGWINGGRTRDDGWTAGLSDSSSWRIKVKTNEPNRTAALVRWEVINCYLDAIGREDLTDIWPGQKH